MCTETVYTSKSPKCECVCKFPEVPHHVSNILGSPKSSITDTYFLTDTNIETCERVILPVPGLKTQMPKCGGVGMKTVKGDELLGGCPGSEGKDKGGCEKRYVASSLANG
jgi:hypothetical protein